MQLNDLRKRYPFPNIEGVQSFYFSLDAGGRDLVIDLIKEKKLDLMIEIGCFLCGSTIQWLESRETLTVIGVDPWKADFAAILKRYDGNPVFEPCFAKIDDRQAFIKSVQEHGSYISALANVKKYNDRFIPVKAYSPQVLYELYDMDIRPQLIYFDSNKVLDELNVCRELFPDAILCGDDWTWGADQGFPVQKAVNDFCQRHRLSVTVKRATWMIQL
jgi:hypothetical protein